MTITFVRGVKLGVGSPSFIPVTEITSVINLTGDKAMFKTREGYKYECASTEGSTRFQDCLYKVTIDPKEITEEAAS